MQLHLEFAVTTLGTLATRAEDTVAEGVLVNMADEPVEVDLVELTSPSLALEIVRDNGEPVRMPPPPTPGRPDVIVIAPGERRSVLFRAFVSTSAPSGLYRVRLRYRDARSEWVELEIA